jgi:hypothetical protein
MSAPTLNSDAVSMLRKWFEDGVHVHVTVFGDVTDVVLPFCTVVEFLESPDTRLSVVVSGTKVSMEFLLEIASIDIETPPHENWLDTPLARRIGKRNWVVLKYQKYKVCFADLP